MQSHVDTYHLPGSMKLSAPHSTALERGAKRKRDRAFVCPIPHRTVWLLFLDPRRLRPCCGPIPFTETFPAPAISALDKAWSQVVATAVAADQLLGLGLTPGLFPHWLSRLGTCRIRRLSERRLTVRSSRILLILFGILLDVPDRQMPVTIC